MKTKLFLSLALILNNTLSAQINIPITDTIQLQKFKEYANNIITLKVDTTFQTIYLNQYKLIYSASCQYSEVIFHGGMQSIYHTNTCGDSLFGNQYYIDSINSSKDYSQYPTVYGCLENPKQYNDSTKYSLVQDSTTNNVEISPRLNNHSIYSTSSKIRMHDIKSFNSHQYIIIEQSLIYSHCSQTSWGTTFTYYLEKID